MDLYEAALLWKGAAGSLDNYPGGEVTGSHALVEAFTQQQLRQEATNKCVARSIGVHQQLRGQRVHGVLNHLAHRRH